MAADTKTIHRRRTHSTKTVRRLRIRLRGAAEHYFGDALSTTLNPDEDVPHLNGGPFAAARGRDARLVQFGRDGPQARGTAPLEFADSRHDVDGACTEIEAEEAQK